ncbi:MAG: hypothetical protein KFB96_02930 [Thiocapsa sp.]|uniref:hypothetical protein n=1 Tax=Thiocapsa sp. TaxID=2024551 RepID=UPI001BCE7D73|nr:hypothetical protein [Thiocapsa sp.]QVL49490.1 MAG: hypothetical protein KFB96_02930 [Thiocapsa sp.]
MTVIEASLFDPSLRLVQRFLDDDPALTSEERTSLAADEGIQTHRQALDEADVSADTSAVVVPVALPNHLAEMVRQRVAVQDRNLSPAPLPGLIVRIDQAVGPDGPLGWDIAHPFVVLLSEPTEHPDIWYGWLMSSETDYAGHWDLLLEETDQTYDPLAAMVQTWNPVHLYVDAISAPLGQLSPERLATVRELAQDLGGAQPDASDAAPGTLVQRTTSGDHLVLTGSPLGDGADPRWRYQELYFEAAGFVRTMARKALEHLAARQASSWWESVMTGLRTAAETAGITLTPVTAATLGDEAAVAAGAEQVHRIGEMVELRLLPSTEGDAVQLHLVLAQTAPLRVGLALGARVRQQALLTQAAPETDLFAGADQALTFFIRDEDDQVRFSMALGKVSDPH